MRVKNERMYAVPCHEIPNDVQVFISYAHVDTPLFRQALLGLMCFPGTRVTPWTDEKILAGSNPDKEIRAALESMDIFVALITPYFAASRYIQEVEVPIAKKRYEKGEIQIAPVVVSDPGVIECDWLLKLERLPHKQKSWSEIRRETLPTGGYDEALKPLRDGVYKLIQRARSKPRGSVL